MNHGYAEHLAFRTNFGGERMKRVVPLMGLFLWCVLSFSAIVSTSTGNFTAEVLSIDKTGVTIRSRFGVTTFKSSDVKYVLIDESRTELIGRPGVVLKDGLVFHGEPNQITATSGSIVTNYGIIQTTIGSIVYFSYSRYPEYDQFVSLTTGLLPRILGSNTEKAFVTLVNGSKFEISDFKLTQDGTKTRFIFNGTAGTYVFDSNFIDKIEVPLSETVMFQHYVVTKNGAAFLCNVFLSGDNVILTLPYGNRVVLKLAELSAIMDKDFYSPSASRFLIGGRSVTTSYNYDVSSKTLFIYPYTETLSIGGKTFQTVNLTIPKK